VSVSDAIPDGTSLVVSLPGFNGASLNTLTLSAVSPAIAVSATWDSTMQLLTVTPSGGLEVGTFSLTVDSSDGITLPVAGLSTNDLRLKIGLSGTVSAARTSISTSPSVAPVPPVVTSVAPTVESESAAPDGVSGIVFPANSFDESVDVSVGVEPLDISTTPVASDTEPAGDVLTFSVAGGAVPKKEVNISIGVSPAVVEELSLRRRAGVTKRLDQVWFNSVTNEWVATPLPTLSADRKSLSSNVAPSVFASAGFSGLFTNLLVTVPVATTPAPDTPSSTPPPPAPVLQTPSSLATPPPPPPSTAAPVLKDIEVVGGGQSLPLGAILGGTIGGLAVLSAAAVLVVLLRRQAKQAKLSASPDVPDTGGPQNLDLSPISAARGARRYSNNAERRVSAGHVGRLGSNVSTAHSDVVFAEASDAFAGGDFAIGSTGVSRTGSGVRSPLSHKGSLRSPGLEGKGAQEEHVARDRMMEPSNEPTPNVAEAVRRLEAHNVAMLRPLPPKVPGTNRPLGGVCVLPAIAKHGVALEISQPTGQVSASGYPVRATTGALGAVEMSSSNALEISSVASDVASNQSIDSLEGYTPAGAPRAKKTFKRPLPPPTTALGAPSPSGSLVPGSVRDSSPARPAVAKGAPMVIPDIQIENDIATMMSSEEVSLASVQEHCEAEPAASAAARDPPKASWPIREEARMPVSPGTPETTGRPGTSAPFASHSSGVTERPVTTAAAPWGGPPAEKLESFDESLFPKDPF